MHARAITSLLCGMLLAACGNGEESTRQVQGVHRALRSATSAADPAKKAITIARKTYR